MGGRQGSAAASRARVVLLPPPRLFVLLPLAAQLLLGAARLLGDALGRGVLARGAQEDGAAEALVDGLLLLLFWLLLFGLRG
jgi:hypothetical protein